MMGQTIEILAVTHEGIFRAGKVSRTERSVYYVPVVGLDLHLSRHPDGETHWRSQELDFEHGSHRRAALSDLTFEQVFASTLEPLKVPSLDNEYKRKRVDGLFAVDLRRLPVGTPNLCGWLVAPQHFQRYLASQYREELMQFYVNTQLEPWLVLGVLVVKQGVQTEPSHPTGS